MRQGWIDPGRLRITSERDNQKGHPKSGGPSITRLTRLRLALVVPVVNEGFERSATTEDVGGPGDGVGVVAEVRPREGDGVGEKRRYTGDVGDVRGVSLLDLLPEVLALLEVDLGALLLQKSSKGTGFLMPSAFAPGAPAAPSPGTS